MIKREGGKYYVYDDSGTKKLSRGYATKKQAEARLRQIEMFKHMKEDDKKKKKAKP